MKRKQFVIFIAQQQPRKNSTLSNRGTKEKSLEICHQSKKKYIRKQTKDWKTEVYS